MSNGVYNVCINNEVLIDFGYQPTSFVNKFLL